MIAQRITVGVMLMMSVAGCVSETVTTSVDRPPLVKPRQVSPAPQTAEINDLAVLSQVRPFDSNGNGFPNRFDATIFLFSRPYPTPRFASGSIRFSMYEPGTYGQGKNVDAVLVAQWIFDSKNMAMRRFRGVIGDGYTFTLDLSDLGLMSIPVNSADMVVVFEPDGGGDAVQSNSVQTIPYFR